MEVTYIVSLALASASMVFAGFSLFFAIRSQAKTPRGLKRSVEDNELAIADLDERISSLLKSHKKLNSRVAMRQAREAKSDQQLTDTDQKPNESNEMWKSRMRKLMAEGKLTQQFQDMSEAEYD